MCCVCSLEAMPPDTGRPLSKGKLSLSQCPPSACPPALRFPRTTCPGAFPDPLRPVEHQHGVEFDARYVNPCDRSGHQLACHRPDVGRIIRLQAPDQDRFNPASSFPQKKSSSQVVRVKKSPKFTPACKKMRKKTPACTGAGLKFSREPWGRFLRPSLPSPC